ncbi:MAG: DUF58 domain-containing protein [Bacillota bacterium]|nr:DUF58 domain-containing protein [Bacillota bacterium]
MNVALLIISTILIVYIQSRIYRRWGLKSVEYSRSFDASHVFEGEDAHMIEIVSNQKLLPVLWLQLESEIDSNLKFQRQNNLDIKHKQFHKSFFTLMPYTKITRRHSLNCAKRGHYELKSAVLSCNDAFNIIQTYRELSLSANITVYPKVLPIDKLQLPNSSWLGDIVVKRWIVDDPFMISGIRDYQYGDSMNRINWKSTARAGSLKVYNSDYTSNTKIVILLNIQADENSWDSSTDNELMEKAISICASIANYTLSKSIETGFGCNSHNSHSSSDPVYIPAHFGNEHIYCILESMAVMQLKRSVLFHIFLENLLDKDIKNTDFLIVTAFIDEHIEKSIQRMKDQGNKVEVLNLYDTEIYKKRY